jgi:UMF1 family MFS transporter
MSTAYWGYAASISTVIVAIGPVLVSVGDIGILKAAVFAFMAVGVAGCLGLSLLWNGLHFFAYS